MSITSHIPSLAFSVKHAYQRPRFGDVVSIKSGKFNPLSHDGVLPCIELEHLSQGSGEILGSVKSTEIVSQKNKFYSGDVLFSKLRPYLRKYAHPLFNGVCSSEIWVMTTDNTVVRSYLFQYIQTDKFIFEANKSAGSKMPRSDWGIVSEVMFCIPSIEEQQKIASFLTSVDSKISHLTEKHRLLKEYKKGVMQQIFSQQLRFKDEDGKVFPEWVYTRLSSFLLEHKCKNKNQQFGREDVCSVSGEYGVVNQIKHLGRSYAGESIAQYNIVNKGDIVYTKSPLKNNPYGIIKANLGNAGIVSTLYAVYSCKNNALPQYLNYYFSLNDNVNSYLRPLVQKGAKNDMKINNQKVLIDSIDFPCLKEQQKIAQFLQSIDKKIDEVAQQVEQTKQFKKGLLQQMFV